jgi:hypothetical protein
MRIIIESFQKNKKVGLAAFWTRCNEARIRLESRDGEKDEGKED